MFQNKNNLVLRDRIDDDDAALYLTDSSLHCQSRKKRAVTNDKAAWIHEIQDAPVFFPSLEEFSDPMRYIGKIEPLASKYGELFSVLITPSLIHTITHKKDIHDLLSFEPKNGLHL